MNCKRFVVLFAVVVVMVCCVVANAAEFPLYHKIPEDFVANALKAEKRWKGKEVCIRGTVDEIGSNEGDAIVKFRDSNGYDFNNSEPSYDYEYYFRFEGIPDAVTELEKGQTVSIIGIVRNLKYMPIGRLHYVRIDLSQSRID